MSLLRHVLSPPIQGLSSYNKVSLAPYAPKVCSSNRLWAQRIEYNFKSIELSLSVVVLDIMVVAKVLKFRSSWKSDLNIV